MLSKKQRNKLDQVVALLVQLIAEVVREPNFTEGTLSRRPRRTRAAAVQLRHDVLTELARGATVGELAKRYGVTTSYISIIRSAPSGSSAKVGK